MPSVAGRDARLLRPAAQDANDAANEQADAADVIEQCGMQSADGGGDVAVGGDGRSAPATLRATGRPTPENIDGGVRGPG